ncbi:MAG: DUF1080 domain-containing protein [Planctomycetaceae bacterium]|nr:DUF1080 domain-containing protein [Planctomycetaceae bacterium]
MSVLHRWLFFSFVLLSAIGCSREPVSTADSEVRSTGVVTDSAANEGVKFISPSLTEEEIREGWVSLFDGESLYGWDVPTVSNWHVEDGLIVVDSGEKSLLLTPFLFDDFEMRCSFHVAKGGNSGIFLRTADNAMDPALDTYELNICDSHPAYGTGSLVGRYLAKDVPPVEGAWHEFRVLCKGPVIKVWLDEKQIVDFTDMSEGVRLTGRIGLQMNQGRSAFRDVFIRPLSLKPLLNGRDTTGWHVVPGSTSNFSVNDGLLHISGGPGFLESNDTFGDFVLKVEARINGDGLNSGVFFRAKTGTAEAPSHGYEMQLHNGFKAGDRTKPVDSGTGAIFRRAAARYVVANDREFFTAVLVAQGDRFASWVNGYQVMQWQDDRTPNDNPREGRRLDPGHLSLQAHDSTTDLDVRAIDIQVLSSEP